MIQSQLFDKIAENHAATSHSRAMALVTYTAQTPEWGVENAIPAGNLLVILGLSLAGWAAIIGIATRLL